MKWRHQGAWRGEEEEKERMGKGAARRIAFRLCSIKGEITHLLRFFLKPTALIDQTAWMYQPIFYMKYRHQKSITPVFSFGSPVRGRSFPLRLSCSAFVQLFICSSRRRSPTVFVFVTCTLCYPPPLHVGDKWKKSILFNNYVPFCDIVFCAATCLV